MTIKNKNILDFKFNFKEKRRQLSLDNLNSHTSVSLFKKRTESLWLILI